MEMNEEQDAFMSLISVVEKEVGALVQFEDVLRVHTVAKHVRSLEERLESAEKQAALFNAREVLFNADFTDYSALKMIRKNFEPYFNLWCTSSDWCKWHDGWFKCQFLMIDAVDVERKVQVSFLCSCLCLSFTYAGHN